MTGPTIYWFTGQPGAGKTTLGKKLITVLRERGDHVVHLDGDDMREITDNHNYSELGRRLNVATTQRLAAKLRADGLTVVVSMVSPHRDLREAFKYSHSPCICEIYVHTSDTRGREAYHVRDYQPPESAFIDIDTTGVSVESSFSNLLSALDLPSRRYIRKGNGDGQYALFIGRFQPWHAGHRWLIDQALEAGEKVVIAVRDVAIGENNPCTAAEVRANISAQLSDLMDRDLVKVIIVPDIHSVNFGREVGYSIIEHFPPPAFRAISATELRRNRWFAQEEFNSR